MTAKSEALRPIARYKIGYATDDWGMRSSTPSGIPDPAGAWVRYEDHIAAMAGAQQPAPSAAAAKIEGGPPGSGGWEKHAIEMERQRDYYRQRCHTMEEHQKGGVWYWQGDDGDNLESMGNSMLVVMRADQLRSLTQPSPTPQAGSQPAPEYVGNGMFKGETIQKAAEHWANWCDVRCIGGVAEFLRFVAKQAGSQPAPVLDRARIREIFMAHGFTVKEGQNDLKQYVYDAADALLRAARAPADSVTAPAGWKLVPIEPSVDQEWEGKEASSRVSSMAEACKIYKAMLAAAPTPPAQATGGVLEYAATPTAASIAWTALRDLTDPLGEAGVKIMGRVRIYAQRQYEAGLTEGRATQPAQAADSVLEDAARYRWLREKPGTDLRYGSEQYTRVCAVCQNYGADLDAAIDAARKQGGAT